MEDADDMCYAFEAWQCMAGLFGISQKEGTTANLWGFAHPPVTDFGFCVHRAGASRSRLFWSHHLCSASAASTLSWLMVIWFLVTMSRDLSLMFLNRFVEATSSIQACATISRCFHSLQAIGTRFQGFHWPLAYRPATLYLCQRIVYSERDKSEQ